MEKPGLNQYWMLGNITIVEASTNICTYLFALAFVHLIWLGLHVFPGWKLTTFFSSRKFWAVITCWGLALLRPLLLWFLLVFFFISQFTLQFHILYYLFLSTLCYVTFHFINFNYSQPIIHTFIRIFWTLNLHENFICQDL